MHTKKAWTHLYIINLRSWKLPMRYNDTIVHASRYSYPFHRQGSNTPKDVNAYCSFIHRIETSTFQIGTKCA